GAAAGWAGAAAGYGAAAVAVGLVLAVLPAVAAVVFVVVPELRGRDPVDRVRHLVRAWYEVGPPWQVGVGLLAGVVLWGAVGGDVGHALAAAAVPGAAGGARPPATGRGVVIADSDRGLVVVAHRPAVAEVRAQGRARWGRKAIVRGGDRRVLGPSGLWTAAGLTPFLADEAPELTVPGLREVRVRYVLVVERRAVVVSRSAYDTAVSGMDEPTRAALELELLRGLFGGNPDDAWRPLAAESVPPSARPAPEPVLLPAVDHVETLGNEYGQPNAVLVRPRGAGSRRLVVHPRGADLARVLDTAVAYRVLGAPAVPTWPAVLAEDVLDADGAVVLRAGETVEVGHLRPGGRVDLADPVQLAQVARLFAFASVLGDDDLRGLKEDNLVRDRFGNVGLVDFDTALQLDLGPSEAVFRIGFETAAIETRSAQRVFGLLTEADVLAGYRYVVARRAELLAVIRDPLRRVAVGARVDWM